MSDETVTRDAYASKKTDGFKSVKTFLKVDIFDRNPAALTPKNLIVLLIVFRHRRRFLLFFLIRNFKFFLTFLFIFADFLLKVVSDPS